MAVSRGLDQTTAWVLAIITAGAAFGAGYGLSSLWDRHGGEPTDGADASAEGEAPEAGPKAATETPAAAGGAPQAEGNHEAKAATAAKSEAAPPRWDYKGSTGPDHWGALGDAFATCAAGKHQSPIDFDAPPTNTKLLPIKFHYKEAEASVRNAGNAVQVDLPSGNFVEVDGERFDLKSLTFHTPSEHKVAGIPYDLELQMLHQNAEGRVLVIAALFEEGAPNKALATVLRELPTAPDTGTAAVTLDPAALLPPRRLYYHYLGSLTTPPCTESVGWYVLTQPGTVATKQIDALASVIPFNARPTRPLNGRKVVKSSR